MLLESATVRSEQQGKGSTLRGGGGGMKVKEEWRDRRRMKAMRGEPKEMNAIQG